MKFKELSWVCKVGIVGGWIVLVEWILVFMYGFFTGLGGGVLP